MEEVYVFVAEGTLYKCDKASAQATITKQEWDALNLEATFEIKAGKPVAIDKAAEEVLVEIPPKSPLPLSLMYEEAKVGLSAKVDALWDHIVLQDSAKMEAIIEGAKAVEAEHKRLTELYEASKL